MKQKLKTRKYRCSKCGIIVTRVSDKQWIRSYCAETGMFTRLIIVKKDCDILKEKIKIKCVNIELFIPC